MHRSIKFGEIDSGLTMYGRSPFRTSFGLDGCAVRICFGWRAFVECLGLGDINSENALRLDVDSDGSNADVVGESTVSSCGS